MYKYVCYGYQGSGNISMLLSSEKSVCNKVAYVLVKIEAHQEISSQTACRTA